MSDDVRHETILAEATAAHPRETEGTALALADGRILLLWAQYFSGSTDWTPAHIVGRHTADGGRTWGEQVEVVPNRGRMNTCCPCLVRLQSGRIGLAYFVKNDEGDCRVWWQTSADEAQTWSAPVLACPPELGYHQIHNDRAVQLRGGRIVLPLSTTDGPRYHPRARLFSFCYLSDDEGQTWRRSRSFFDVPKRGAMEPVVVERRDGSVLMLIRTQLGHQYQAESFDGGDTWVNIRPHVWLVGSEAPAIVKRIPTTDDLLCVWNRVFDPFQSHGGRSPLNSAISHDDGQTWTNVRTLESAPDHTYAYPSIHFHGDEVLLSYYDRPAATGWLSLKVKVLPVAWFYASEAEHPTGPGDRPS